MKANLKLIGLAVFAAAMTSCGSKSEAGKARNNSVSNPSSEMLAASPVVGEKVAVGEDTLVVVSLKEEPKKVTLRASDLLDGLRLIKLENSDDALVGVGKVWTSGNRLVMYDGSVVKQFDIDGKYLGTVGAKGNGPGEYSIAPYYVYIDEKGGRIGMLQYGAKKVMTYGLDGAFIEDIPLAHSANKGFMKLDAEKRTLAVAALLFNSDENDEVSWTQDFEGNVLSSVKRGNLAVIPDFSNEVMGGMSAGTDDFSYSLFCIENRPDTLYHYRSGDFKPAFTVDYGEEVPTHEYREFPGFYVVTSFGKPNLVSENSYIIPTDSHFVVDKATLKGAPADMLFDNIGTVTLGAGWAYQEMPEYFALAYDPGTLLEMIEAAPAEHPLATEDGLKAMRELKETIDPDDNSYVIFGKWKK